MKITEIDEKMDLTPAEMEFLEMRRFNVEQLLMIFGIPKGMLSSEDSATGRGRTAAKRQFEGAGDDSGAS